MILARTPLRISLAGGGSDLPAFSERYGGGVVSTTIDRWIHVIVHSRFEGDVRVSYSRTEIVPVAADLEHDLVREAMRRAGVERGVEVVTLADVPSHGTGMGSSSAVLVGLLHALHALRGREPAAEDLAREAAEIEIGVLSRPVGRQDHYAAAAGGLNLIEFPTGGQDVRVTPLPAAAAAALEPRLMLFHLGGRRSAADILARQDAAIRDGRAVAALTAMRDLAYAVDAALRSGDVDAVGPLLHENWELKRTVVDGISDGRIDGVYAAARAAGATGGKLLGAGGAGFMLLAVPEDRRDAVAAALDGLRHVPVRLTSQGSHIAHRDDA